MKFFWSVFSLYILLLSFAPCGDSNDCNLNEPTTCMQTNDHGKHDHHSESCSPFCHCACCGQQITCVPFMLPFQRVEKFESIEAPRTIYKEYFISNYIANIWQPPQLS